MRTRTANSQADGAAFAVETLPLLSVVRAACLQGLLGFVPIKIFSM